MVLRHWHSGPSCMAGIRIAVANTFTLNHAINLIFPIFFKFINFQDFPAISNHYTTSMPNLEKAQEQFESELVQWMGERYKIWTVILVVIYFVMMSMALLLLILLLLMLSLLHISFHQVQPTKYHCLFFVVLVVIVSHSIDSGSTTQVSSSGSSSMRDGASTRPLRWALKNFFQDKNKSKVTKKVMDLDRSRLVDSTSGWVDVGAGFNVLLHADMRILLSTQN